MHRERTETLTIIKSDIGPKQKQKKQKKEKLKTKQRKGRYYFHLNKLRRKYNVFVEQLKQRIHS